MEETYTTYSDNDILEQSFKKPLMFEVLVDRYEAAFMRKSMSVLHSKEAAEDAVQETFIKIYKYGNKFKNQEGASFKSWAYKILMNTCYTHYTRRKHEMKHVELVDFSETEFADLSEDIESIDQSSYIEMILKRMPTGLARMLRLYFLEEKSQKEIARAENLSLEAVRTRMHRAKKYFKDLNIKSL